MRAALAAMSAADVAAHEAAGTMPAALDGQIVPPPARKLESMEDLAARVAGIIAIFAGFWALNQIWRLSDFSLIRSVVDNGTEIAFILLMGYVAYQAARIAIDRKIAEETGSDTPGELGDEGGERGASRLATLLPLLRSAILIMIVVSVAAMVLMRFGVNLGPIVAGAGILGIAVGFGAQYLVRDIFSGIFFLIDDAFRKGEYIDVGDVKGTVEKISIRSFQLRHHLGPLHTIPFGEIKSLTNYSRDWVIMKLPLRVTYDTDVDKVRKLIKRLGQELLEDPVIGNQFLQPLKSQGVIEMQDSAMIIRVKFMTKPGDQWTVRQRVYAEIRALFEREGVKFAHREVTVRVANVDADTLTPRQREAIAGAALQDDAALPEMDFAEAR
jgi:small-conductance mechanosensitive channel